MKSRPRPRRDGEADLNTAWGAEIPDQPNYEPEADAPEATAEI